MMIFYIIYNVILVFSPEKSFNVFLFIFFKSFF